LSINSFENGANLVDHLKYDLEVDFTQKGESVREWGTKDL